MGSYEFKWSQPASEVYVTGTFDNWAKTQKLDKHGFTFSKRIPLPSREEQYYFKYFVDGEWKLDEGFATANDAQGNTNNILYPGDIEALDAAAPASAGGAILTGAAAGGTTAALAGAVPLEKDKAANNMPGGFPVTPAQELSSFDASAASSDPTFSVSPLPASGGGANPITTRPGESLPPTNTYTGHSVTSNVTLDKGSYEKADAIPPVAAIGTAQSDPFSVPPVSSTMIPESSLPMGAAAGAGVGIDAGPTISSTAGPNTTTAALAAQVPLEPRGVPEVVEKSQETAHASPEASQYTDAVAHKEKMEQELTKKVPEEPATSTDSPISKTATAAAGAAAAGGAAIIGGAAAYAATAQDKVSKAVEDVQAGKNPVTGTGGVPSSTDVATAVPQEVSESIEKAHVSPEAASNPSAVAHKSAMEAELEKKVSPTEVQSGVGPSETTTSALSATAPATATVPKEAEKEEPAGGLTGTLQAAGAAVAGGIAASAAALGLTSATSNDDDASKWGESTTQNISDKANEAAETTTTKAKEAGAATTAAATSGAAAVGLTSGESKEKESSALNAPASSQAQTDATHAASASVPPNSATAPSAASHTTSPAAATGAAAAVFRQIREDSRDVSPMSRGPMVTTGIESAQAPAKSGWQGAEKSTTEKAKDKVAEAKETVTSSASKEDKKKNRRSFFGRIKDKIKDKKDTKN